MMTGEREVYLNGEFLPVGQAKISVMDRGFLFADGVYEVIPCLDGRLVGLEAHLDRLRNSISCISLPFDFTNDFWIDIFKELTRRNAFQSKNQMVYLQITRGAYDTRSHYFPDGKIKPTIFVQMTPLESLPFEKLKNGLSAVMLDDARSNACHIKSISLLPNVLSTQQAKLAQAREAIFIRNGKLTEGASSNVFIIKNGEILTPVATNQILKGITREIVLSLAKVHHIPHHEIEIDQETLLNADEVWLTSSTKEIMPIVKIDEHVVGDGKAGKLWFNMMAHYQAYKDALPKFI